MIFPDPGSLKERVTLYRVKVPSVDAFNADVPKEAAVFTRWASVTQEGSAETPQGAQQNRPLTSYTVRWRYADDVRTTDVLGWRGLRLKITSVKADAARNWHEITAVTDAEAA